MGQLSNSVIAVIVIFFVLSWIAVGLRIYTRLVVRKGFGADDAFIVAMQVVYTVYLSGQIIGWKHGMGRHESELTPEDRRVSLMWWFICYLLYIICVGLFKISLGFFLLRIAVDKIHIMILQFFTLGTFVVIFVYFFLVMFQCHPMSTFWEESPRAPGKCFSDTVLLGLDFTVAIINCSADWVYGILPLFIVRSLKMPRRTKIMVMAILSFAAAGSTATFIRMFWIPNLLKGDDFLYNTGVVAYLSTVECGVGITAVSIGTLKPLWDHMRQSRASSAANSNSLPWSSRNRNHPARKSYIRTGDVESNGGIGLQNVVVSNNRHTSGSLTLVSKSPTLGPHEDKPATSPSGWETITKTVEVTRSESGINGCCTERDITDSYTERDITDSYTESYISGSHGSF